MIPMVNNMEELKQYLSNIGRNNFSNDENAYLNSYKKWLYWCKQFVRNL